MKISPQYFQSYLAGVEPEKDLDRFIDVYQDRISGWLLDSVQILNNHQHAGFAALQLLLVYFEQHAIFHKGENSDGASKKFFIDGFRSVFPEFMEKLLSEKRDQNFLDRFYKQVRCGLYHQGMTRSQIILTSEPEALQLSDDNFIIYINHKLVFEAVKSHLCEYVRRLRDPSESMLQGNFIKACKIVHKE